MNRVIEYTDVELDGGTALVSFGIDVYDDGGHPPEPLSVSDITHIELKSYTLVTEGAPDVDIDIESLPDFIFEDVFFKIEAYLDEAGIHE